MAARPQATVAFAAVVRRWQRLAAIDWASSAQAPNRTRKDLSAALNLAIPSRAPTRVRRKAALARGSSGRRSKTAVASRCRCQRVTSRAATVTATSAAETSRPQARCAGLNAGFPRGLGEPDGRGDVDGSGEGDAVGLRVGDTGGVEGDRVEGDAEAVTADGELDTEPLLAGDESSVEVMAPGSSAEASGASSPLVAA